MSVIYVRLLPVSCYVLEDWLACVPVCDALLSMSLLITFCRLHCNGLR